MLKFNLMMYRAIIRFIKEWILNPVILNMFNINKESLPRYYDNDFKITFENYIKTLKEYVIQAF